MVSPAGQDSARALFWKLVWLYQGGCFTAVAIVFALVFLGLEFSLYQWGVLLAMSPVVIAIYNLTDVWLMARHYRPLGHVLRALDERRAVGDPELAEGLITALNLPFLSFLRVTLLHGPLVTVLVILTLLTGNTLFATGWAEWQFWAFGATTLFFASPTHAIFEFFGVSRTMVPVIQRLNGELGRELAPAELRRLFWVRLRSKLLYLAIFVTGLPLVFFASSVVFKVERLLANQGVPASLDVMAPFYAWIVGVVAVCAVGAVLMALLTANEVSRSAARLIAGMRKVESGALEEARLEVVSTDEYADIFRGFQHMLDALREEQRILGVSHDLAGELQLDLLIARIMRVASDLLHAERSTLFIHDPRTDELFSFFAEGTHLREIRIPASRGIAGAVFKSGMAENIADPYADPRFDPSVDRATGFRTRSILCTPIANKAGGRIGVAQVLNKRGDAAFSAKDEARLRAFSAQIAVSLENAKLFDDVLAMKNYNESILKSTSNGIVTLDSDNRVVTANDAATQILGVERVDLVGQAAATVFDGPNRWIADSLHRIAPSGETTLGVDAEIARPDAKASSVNLTAAPLIDANGRRIGSMLVLEDITSEKRVRSTMARYMSKEVADQLLQDGEDALTGKDQTVSILFSDVRGFTTIAEAIGARETVAMLNGYFTEMVDVILANGGILDKYIGDAIMALFGAPFANPADADNAVRTANQMMLALAAFNDGRRAQGQLPIDIGVGIATGDVVVGNIGSLRRMEYTVIGDSVNLASRLEGTNKVYGTKILLSESTRGRLKDRSLTREIDLIRVKGKDFPVAIYESLAYRAGELDRGLGAMLGAYDQGLAAYRARAWGAAEQAFASALDYVPDDGPSLMYLARCRQFRDSPPPADWNGVWILTEK
ncbi:adenylate/guanylate cyclase domain-containing protein [Zavarzinia sp. CC-PAN008]|uniref:adenylate/guanylate cyclase domain-containing protein n=1 Tax=Zavarzinia sp. CC-PAN008 TaxID=3243332 RepID=UPI003F747ACE